MEPLARIDYFDFDDPAFAAAHGVDGMHADRAISSTVYRLKAMRSYDAFELM